MWEGERWLSPIELDFLITYLAFGYSIILVSYYYGIYLFIRALDGTKSRRVLWHILSVYRCQIWQCSYSYCLIEAVLLCNWLSNCFYSSQYPIHSCLVTIRDWNTVCRPCLDFYPSLRFLIVLVISVCRKNNIDIRWRLGNTVLVPEMILLSDDVRGNTALVACFSRLSYKYRLQYCSEDWIPKLKTILSYCLSSVPNWTDSKNSLHSLLVQTYFAGSRFSIISSIIHETHGRRLLISFLWFRGPIVVVVFPFLLKP